MTAAMPAPPPTLMPTGRFEWERIVRRAILPEPVKFMAFVLGSYADPDGSRVRPGNEVLAAVTGKGVRTVRRLLADLLELGLIELVTRGGGRGRVGHASVYRLTLPTDLLDRIELLLPGDRSPNPPAIQVAGESTDPAATQMAPQCGQSPVDNSDPEDTQMAAQSVAPEPIEGPLGDSSERLRGQTRSIEGPRREPMYHPPTPATKDDHPTNPDPAQPPTARETEPPEDHPESNETTTAAPEPERCPHRLVRRNRPDGKPACALCRRDAPRGPT